MRFANRPRAAPVSSDDCFEVVECIVTGECYVTEKTHPTGRITTKVADQPAACRLVIEHRKQHDATYHWH